MAGPPIKHRRGLRQVGPLSPLLFVIAIDPLQHLIDLETRRGLLRKIRRHGTLIRTSLYADDAAVFMAPIKRDINNLFGIVQCFGDTTNLATNFQKSSVVPIRCGYLNLG